MDGRAVCPEHIEADVKRLHRMLAESVAFAVHGDRADELVIVLGVRDQHEIDIPAFTKMVERVLAERWSIVPRAVVFVAARRIRRTTSGKVQRQAMRQDYLAHAFDDAMPGARVPVTPRSAAARA